MGTLDIITQMKQSGNTDSQIINYLMRQGIPPREINDALSQSQIKQNLVSSQDQQFGGPQVVSEMPALTNPNSQMQPSMMQNQQEEANPTTTEEDPPQQMQAQMQAIPSSFQPSTASAPPYPQYQDMQQPTSQEGEYAYPQDATQYSQQDYSQYSQYSPTGDIETMNEIADQIAEEKTSRLKKEMIRIVQFSKELESDVEKINKRVEKIESKLDDLQMSILGKIGEYGKSIQNISKEMRATQDSFSKVLNPLTDNVRRLEKINQGNKEESKNRAVIQNIEVAKKPISREDTSKKPLGIVDKEEAPLEQEVETQQHSENPEQEI
jgi:hypothetical protein